jgi:hypothetical protein
VDGAAVKAGSWAIVMACAAAVGAVACGGRTGLDEATGPLDGGLPPLPPPDASLDVGPPPWDVTCSDQEIETPNREPIDLTAEVMPEGEVAQVRWRVVERPTGSATHPEPRVAKVTSFTPDVAGEYLLMFTATASNGASASCEVRIVATPTEPVAVCPGTVQTSPLTAVQLEGQVVADRPIVSYQWELTQRPAASAARPPSPSDARVTEFRPDVAGEYLLRFTVVDTHGEEGSCTVRVRAIASEGLRVEIYWNGPPDRSCGTWGGATPWGPCDPTDVDLHLLRPGSEFWFSNVGDCHWRNCTGSGLPWGAAGTEADDPRLDLDVVTGFGPENINIDEPYPGVYRVGVDFWDGHGWSTADVTVNIYCGAASTTPTRTFGPTRLGLNTATSRDDNDFWVVADVEIREGGLPCAVTDLSTSGRPRIITHRQAWNTR